VYRSAAINIASLKDDTTQVVNGQRPKHYIAGDSYNEDVDVIQTVSPEEFIQDNMQEPAEFVFEYVTVLVRKGSQKTFLLIFLLFLLNMKNHGTKMGRRRSLVAPHHQGARAHPRPRRPVVRPPRSSFPSRFPPVISFRCIIFAYITPQITRGLYIMFS
jgi:hypothetical protein